MASNPNREKILARLDIRTKFEEAGVHVAEGAVENAEGWLKSHSFYSEDKHPSAAINVGTGPKRGLYHDFVLGITKSIFDIMAEAPGFPFMTGKEAYMHYGRETGVFKDDSSSTYKKSQNSHPKGKIVARYNYHDAAGNLVLQVCRTEPKSFFQRHPDGAGGWINNLKGVELVPYRLPELKQAALVFVVEGEKDVDRLRALGLTATCNAQGAGKWKKAYNQYLKSKAVVILTDADDPGRAHGQEVARNLHNVAAIIKVIELPGLPPKGDVSDWLDAGGTLEQLRALVQAAPEWDPATAPPSHEESQKSAPDSGEHGQAVPKECGHHYALSNGCHCLVVLDGEGVREKPLSNFIARVTDEVTRDDGAKITKEFVIAGNVGDLQLPSARVPTRDFDKLSWPREQWGSAASVAPSRSNAAHLPNAILTHSRSQGINRRTVYGHAGWRKINGVWRYMHGGGAIGPGEAVEVDLGENLHLYRLPSPGGLEAAQASLRFLDVAPWEVTAPLLACVYLAPFSDLLKIDFSLWVYGPSGAMKSTLAALALAHFGRFSRTTLPGSWFSTVNSLEKLCFILKDSLVVIDDFMPASNSKESHRMGESAARLIYQSGNRSSRGRLMADLSARPNHYPRCLIISTGEMLLPGQRQSATARYLGVELDPKKTPLDRTRLTAAQAEADLYAEAMATYLEDLAHRLDKAQEELRALFECYRGAFQNGGHARIPEIQAWLAVGFEYFLRFQVRMDAVTQELADQMLNQAWKVFEALGEKHSRIIAGERPTLKFLAILRELFLQGRIYVQSATMSGAPPSRKDDLGWLGSDPARNSEQVGWAGDDILYLIPEMTFKMVAETVNRQGDFLTLGKNEMLAALAREGIIEPGKGENTKIKKILGSSRRVIALPFKNLFLDEADDEA
jgi:hypothetical protein